MKPLLCSASVVRNLLNSKVGAWPAEAINSSKPFQWQDRRPGKIQSKEYAGLGVEYVQHATKGLQAIATFDAYPGQGAARHGICASPISQGDVLYVRETCAHFPGERNPWLYRATIARDDDVDRDFKWTPAIHAPKESSRIHLEVMRVRVERACDISEEDALAEGMPAKVVNGIHSWPSLEFKSLWQSLYGPDAWEKWVWVYDLKRIK